TRSPTSPRPGGSRWLSRTLWCTATSCPRPARRSRAPTDEFPAPRASDLGRPTPAETSMRTAILGMNVTQDGDIASPGDVIDWSAGDSGAHGGPSDELFRFWLEEEQASELTLYGRKLWETMSSYWPTGDQQPGAGPLEIEFARNWRDTPKVVFSSTL